MAFSPAPRSATAVFASRPWVGTASLAGRPRNFPVSLGQVDGGVLAFSDNMQRWGIAHLRRAVWPVMSAQVTPLVLSVCLNLICGFPPYSVPLPEAHTRPYISVQHSCWTRFLPPPIRTPTRPLYASPTRHTYQLTRARGRPKQTEHVQLRLQSENRYLNCSVQFQYLAVCLFDCLLAALSVMVMPGLGSISFQAPAAAPACLRHLCPYSFASIFFVLPRFSTPALIAAT